MIKVVQRTYTLPDYNNSGTAPIMPGNVMDYVRCVTEIYVEWKIEGVYLSFVAADDTIAIANNLDYRNFLDEGFKVGDTIEITGTASNDGTYTVDDISEDGRTLFVAEALTDEVSYTGNVYGTTPVTALDYKTNLIPSTDAIRFESMTDEGTEGVVTFTNIDATDQLSAVNGFVKTNSRAWFSPQLTDSDTGETDKVTIIGGGIVDYKQYFEITENFFVSPMFLLSQTLNFSEIDPPAYYLSGSTIRHVLGFGAKYDSSDLDYSHYVEDDGANTSGSWFNRGAQGRLPEYYLDSIAYEDAVTTDAMDALDLTRSTKVTITIKSRSGVIIATGGGQQGNKVILGLYFPSFDASDFQNTLTTMRENFYLDRVYGQFNMAATDGEQFGTDYQSIENAEFTRVDANTATIEFIFTPSAALVTYLSSKADEERPYVIYVAPQTWANTTKSSDRVSVLCAYSTATWDRTDEDLVEFTGNGLTAHLFPDTGTVGWGSVSGFDGDKFYINFPFRVDNTATVRTLSFDVVGKKANETDFVFEGKTFDFTNVCVVRDVQQIYVEESRGFISYDGDVYNTVEIVEDEPNTTGSHNAYIARYPFIVRYEDWLNALIDQPANDLSCADIQKSFEDVTQRWSLIDGNQGWSVVMRVTLVVADADGNESEFIGELPFSILSNSINWVGGVGNYDQRVEYWNTDNDVELNIIQKNGRTLVNAIFEGDFTLPSNADDYVGVLIAQPIGGTVYGARFANSETTSEADSPWSDPGDLVNEYGIASDMTHANGNIRVSHYPASGGDPEQVIVSGIFDSSAWNQTDEKIVILARFGVNYLST